MLPIKSKPEKIKALKPARNKETDREDEQFKKDLKELEELKILNKQMAININNL
jgi:hypothetical protein